MTFSVCFSLSTVYPGLFQLLWIYKITVCCIGVTHSTFLRDWDVSVRDGRHDWCQPIYSQSCDHSRYVTICHSIIYRVFHKNCTKFALLVILTWVSSPMGEEAVPLPRKKFPVSILRYILGLWVLFPVQLAGLDAI